jgi:hypothetical protein
MKHNPYSPPQSITDEQSIAASAASGPTRGVWLTSVLLLLFLTNVILAFFYLMVALEQIVPSRNAHWAPTLLALATANVVVLVAIWNWRRWGYFGLFGTTTLVFCTNIAQGQTVRNAAIGILGLSLVIVAASFKLQHLK